MTVKEAIHELTESLDDRQARNVLDYMHSVLDGDVHTESEGSRSEIPLVEFQKIGKPTSDDDPLWNIVGMIGEDVDVPTDLARNHDRYLAEIYADHHKS